MRKTIALTATVTCLLAAAGAAGPSANAQILQELNIAHATLAKNTTLPSLKATGTGSTRATPATLSFTAIGQVTAALTLGSVRLAGGIRLTGPKATATLTAITVDFENAELKAAYLGRRVTLGTLRIRDAYVDDTVTPARIKDVQLTLSSTIRASLRKRLGIATTIPATLGQLELQE